ncbi:MAG: hypothetical protein Tsb0020_29880 [Haliangiales bacterium]
MDQVAGEQKVRVAFGAPVGVDEDLDDPEIVAQATLQIGTYNESPVIREAKHARHKNDGNKSRPPASIIAATDWPHRHGRGRVGLGGFII